MATYIQGYNFFRGHGIVPVGQKKPVDNQAFSDSCDKRWVTETETGERTDTYATEYERNRFFHRAYTSHNAQPYIVVRRVQHFLRCNVASA